jgi:predicted RNA polymerase sigma factor
MHEARATLLRVLSREDEARVADSRAAEITAAKKAL